MSKPGRRRRTPERRIAEKTQRSAFVTFEREVKSHMIDDAIAKVDPAQLEALAHPVSETDPTEALRNRINQTLHQH